MRNGGEEVVAWEEASCVVLGETQQNETQTKVKKENKNIQTKQSRNKILKKCSNLFFFKEEIKNVVT